MFKQRAGSLLFLLALLMLMTTAALADTVSRDLVSAGEVVGSVTVSNDTGSIYVDVEAFSPWLLAEADAYADAPIPTTGDPSAFPYHQDFPAGATNCSFEVPLKWGYTTINVAVHATVMQPGEPAPSDCEIVSVPLVSRWLKGGKVSVVSTRVDEVPSLKVELAAPEGWELAGTFLYVDKAAPKNPVPWHFPYQHWGKEVASASSDSYTLALDDLGLGDEDVAYFSAYVVVRKVLFTWHGRSFFWYWGLWAKGKPIHPGCPYGLYFTGTISSGSGTPGVIYDEAWAAGDAPLPTGEGSYFQYQVDLPDWASF